MINKVYGIFSGCYSDWNVYGFIDNKEDAEKYCASENNKNKDIPHIDNLYVIELNDLKGDLNFKDVKLKYYHTVLFDFDFKNDDVGMRDDEPDRYEYYIGETKENKIIYDIRYRWISFSLNCEIREKAEKIAQDKFAEFLYHYSENNNYEMSAKLIGGVEQE